MSQQIRLLEEQLGTALFVRSQHRVELTEAGKTLKEQVPLIVAQFDRAIDLTRCAGRGEVGRLAVGIISSAMVVPIPRALRVFAERHPHVHWSLHEMTPAAQIDALKEKRLDVCFFRLFQDDPSIRSEIVVRETAVAVLPSGHPLASRDAIALGELAGEQFVSFGLRHSQLARFLQQSCVDARFTPRIAHEVVEVHTLLSLVREGLGVALLPASSRQISTAASRSCRCCRRRSRYRCRRAIARTIRPRCSARSSTPCARSRRSSARSARINMRATARPAYRSRRPAA